MNKIWLFGAAFCLILGLGSCKPKQSAYKAAYEQAREGSSTDTLADETFVEEEDFDDFDEFEEEAEEVEVAPVSKPRTLSESENRNEEVNVATRQERINPYVGESTTGLRRYSVVIGSFRNSTNAQALKERMQYEGYNAILAQNEMGMLRVIVSSFDSKMDAIYSRDAFRSKFYPNFQDAWVLERRY